MSDGEVRAAAADVASTLSSQDPALMGPGAGVESFEPHVESALRDAESASDNGVPLTLARRDTTASPPRPPQEGDQAVEHYTISADGEHTVCLTVTGTNIGEYGSPYGPSPEPTYQYSLSATTEDGTC